MRKFIVILILCVIGLSSNAQLMRKKNPKMTNRKHMSLIDFKGYKSSGWLLAPGITYTHYTGLDSSDYNSKYIYPTKGIGFYFEFGRYNIMYNGGRFLNYIDYSVAYKGLGRTSYVTGNFNANSIFQTSNYTFIQNSLGVNIDAPFSNFAQPKGEIHYKFGFGMKMTKRWFLIPSIEIPIFNAYGYEQVLNPPLVYNTGFQSAIFSVRMAWLRPMGGLSCGTGKKKKRSKPSSQEQDAQKRYDNR